MSNPAVRIAICGHALPPGWKLRWSDPRIEWQSFCPDLRDLQCHSAIFFAPLRHGGGSKLKVLEAMAAGLPVVTTSQGVSGLDVENGMHYLGSDDPADLALFVTQLLAQPLRLKQLSDAARDYVRREHDWSVAANQLESVYARLLNDARNAPATDDSDAFEGSAE
jgi:glycosyltransferase involved in cell wall biosynthesis